MTLPQKVYSKLAVRWLPIVISVEVCLAILYVISVYHNRGQATPLFDFDGLRSIPSCIQATQLVLLGVIPLGMVFKPGSLTVRKRKEQIKPAQIPDDSPDPTRLKVPPCRLLLAIASLFFIYAAIDELVKLNQIFGQHHLWRFIYVGLGFSMPILFYRDFIELCRFHPQAVRIMAIGVVIFLLGGFGMEIFRAYVQEPHWYPLFSQWKFYQVDAIRTAIEEFSELLGESLLLHGVIRLAQKRWAVLHQG